jgi:hypothetical protein
MDAVEVYLMWRTFSRNEGTERRKKPGEKLSGIKGL